MENKEYWEDRLPQRWYSKETEGSSKYYREIADKRYLEYFPYLMKEAEFMEHPGEKVLEIGCGIGTDLLQYALGGAKCYGCDLTENAVKTTAERFKKLGFWGKIQRADAENLPYEDNFFDVVYSFGVIHHVKNMHKAMKEIHRVLKPGGKAILWLYGKDWKYSFWFPLYHFITKGKLEDKDKLMHLYMEVEGNVPIVRMFHRNELEPYFSYFKSYTANNYRSYGQSLGERFKSLNMALCNLMSKLSPYNAWMVKAIK